MLSPVFDTLCLLFGRQCLRQRSPPHTNPQGTKELKFSSPVQYKKEKPAALTTCTASLLKSHSLASVTWSHRTRLSTKTSLIIVNVNDLIIKYPTINSKSSPSEKIDPNCFVEIHVNCFFCVSTVRVVHQQDAFTEFIELENKYTACGFWKNRKLFCRFGQTENW